MSVTRSWFWQQTEGQRTARYQWNLLCFHGEKLIASEGYHADLQDLQELVSALVGSCNKNPKVAAPDPTSSTHHHPEAIIITLEQKEYGMGV
jgi:hypothetical protein